MKPVRDDPFTRGRLSSLQAQVVAAAEKDLPIGALIAIFHVDLRITPVPDGWLLCRGGNASISQYPLLGKLLGNLFGTAPTGFFVLPTITNPGTNTAWIIKGK